MFTYRKYRVPVRLSAEQKADVTRMRHGQRHAYNWAVSNLREGWDPNDEYGLSARFTRHKRCGDERMRSVPRAIQNAGIRDAFTAAKSVRRRGRNTISELRYRTRKSGRGAALRCPLAPAVVDRRLIKLPRFGTVRCDVPDALLAGEPRSYEFVRTAGGRYALYVSCRVGVPVAHPTGPGTTVKGVDRGAVEPTVVVTLDLRGRPLAADSYDTASAFKDGRASYQRHQRRLSKQNGRSGRYRDHLRMLNKRLRRALNRRAYAECVAAKEICRTGRPRVIVMEDLNLSSMTRRGGSRKRGLNREMRFVRHRAIEQRIRNRAEMEGVVLKHVAPYYTSQTCPGCGHTDRDSRVTRDVFRCVSCHYIQQADVSAAIIVGRAGLRPADAMQEAGPPEAGMAFVRRELDARRGRFLAAGSPVEEGGCENQASARHHSKTERRNNAQNMPGPRPPLQQNDGDELMCIIP